MLLSRGFRHTRYILDPFNSLELSLSLIKTPHDRDTTYRTIYQVSSSLPEITQQSIRANILTSQIGRVYPPVHSVERIEQSTTSNASTNQCDKSFVLTADVFVRYLTKCLQLYQKITRGTPMYFCNGHSPDNEIGQILPLRTSP